MSKYYLVKETSIATPENPDFAGQVSISYYGKDQELNLAHLISECGYIKACDTTKSWIYKHPKNTKYWKSTVKIVEFDV